MFLPRKPWTFGNEYHTICDCQSGVLFKVDLVKGKDRPKELGLCHLQSHEKKPTVGLLLRMTKPLWYTVKVIIMDSGFFVLESLLEIKKKGVYGSAQIKKRHYWPKDVPGEFIKMSFADKDVGYVNALPGIMSGIPFHIVAMKEPEYVTMKMTTFGSMQVVQDHKTSHTWTTSNGQGQKTSHFKILQYIENFSLYYRNRHQIDNHNHHRHSPISIEKTWGTKTWEHRVFAYLLSTSEVNAFKWKLFSNLGIKNTSTLSLDVSYHCK